ncbi:DNA/RNA non-specific endonuclease [Bacillus sp. SJS]|uniref:DNA/RNA non-specific endonuclease n=1 Tax=Bacillus sp. SJS TaxID=1423321 RepID=UPI0004DD263C|nr:DNA/RNA non-specific endonuclease [Bacillus sp. SJS]KZZ84821.1 endonuclease [Bacillus sp. SJS]
MTIIRVKEPQKQWNQASSAQQEQQAMKRYEHRSNEREKLAKKLETKNPLEVDTPERAAYRQALVNPRDGLALERIVGENNLFPISYLESGIQASKSVCRIEVRDRIGRVLGHGTGFLVSPSLLLTNHHVLVDEDAALNSLAQFNYELDLNLREKQIKSFRITPERLFITNEEMDFTLTAVEEISADGSPLSDFGFLPLHAQSGKGLVGEYVSIIQHPSGAPKSLAIRDNKITDVFDDYIHYSTDTQEGSSGSPVLNDEWVIVALHHAGVPDPENPEEYTANEGIRISSIVKFLSEQKASLKEHQKELLSEILGDIKAEQANPKPVKVEKLKPSRYEKATGYDSKFLGTKHAVSLPKLSKDQEADAAPVKAGGNVLDYTHFSLVMSKKRRIAYYTVVNIDGKQLKEIERDKDSWYYDPRIDEKYQAGEELYSRNDLDRGHLVRRRDPVWGSDAKKANDDTFHFTNCSPQHKNLNQKTWLELENYILDNAENHQFKATIFTGPVFRDDDLVYRDIQIPAEFWKVAVMVKEDDTLSATAYLQSQKNLIDDLEFAYGEYKTYQVPLSKIESLTGLQFKDLKKSDSIEKLESAVGRVIEGPEDIEI